MEKLSLENGPKTVRRLIHIQTRTQAVMKSLAKIKTRKLVSIIIRPL